MNQAKDYGTKNNDTHCADNRDHIRNACNTFEARAEKAQKGNYLKDDKMPQLVNSDRPAMTGNKRYRIPHQNDQEDNPGIDGGQVVMSCQPREGAQGQCPKIR